MSTLPGVRTTADATVKQPVTRPPRKKKEPVLDKKQRGERKVKIGVRLEEIALERRKFDEFLARATPEREKYLKNLRDEKLRAAAEIDGILDEHFTDSTSGGLLDRVLKSEHRRPKLDQLQGSVDKVDNAIAWNRSKLAALSREAAQLNKESDDLTAYDLLAECHAEYEAWIATYLDSEMRFEKFKDTILAARQYDRNFLNRLPALGIKDEAFVLIADSKLKNEYIAEVSQDAVVRDMALDYLTKHNQFYQDPSVSVSRRLKPAEPLRRADFNIGQKIGKIA